MGRGQRAQKGQTGPKSCWDKIGAWDKSRAPPEFMKPGPCAPKELTRGQ